MANVKNFADRQTNGRTDRWTGQKLNDPDLSIWGHKKIGVGMQIFWGGWG
jgi:hypothetical protein